MSKLICLSLKQCVWSSGNIMSHLHVACKTNLFLTMSFLDKYARLSLLVLSFLVADIPGLISGAHLNKGLGHAFLRHIERCRCLLYVLDISQTDSLTTFVCLQEELELYKEQLSQRPGAIVANKIDMVESENEIQRLAETLPLPVIPVSAKYGTGIPELKAKLRKLFHDSIVIF